MQATYNLFTKTTLLFVMATAITACDSFLEPDFPSNKLVNEAAFANDNTALSAVSGIYADMMIGADPLYMANGTLGLFGGLCADEMYDYSGRYSDYVNNNINYTGYGPVYYIWESAYNYIYTANLCIEGLNDAAGLTSSVKQQLLGETYFIRAFSYFYLTNLYGAVPLLTGTDYRVNSAAPRTAPEKVYEQIVADLQMAESLLHETYPSADRARPNKFTASALLARVYLYTEDYAAAEAKASEVIDGPYVFAADVADVFLKTSTETIWQLLPVIATVANTLDAQFYVPASVPRYVLEQEFLDSFEKDETDQDIDLRKAGWINGFDYQDNTYYYPYKYKALPADAATEANIVFRLTEQYMIRAEARAQQDKIAEGEEDLNLIRNRAGLKDLSEIITVDRASLLAAIAQERRAEFFAEWGHRWFDLKRTDRADAVLSTTKPDTWNAYAQLWPVPLLETNAAPGLLPNNEGYE